MKSNVSLIGGVIFAAAIGGSLWSAGFPAAACWTAAITTLCGVWWVLEPIPIPATSIIPFALLPLAGVMDHREVAASYGHHIVMLVIGGLMLSAGMEKSGAHRRVAMTVVRALGGQSGRRVVLGFMLASAGMSMWISNTATSVILLPVGLAVLEQTRHKARLAVPLLLGIAYGASVGGIGTPIGSSTRPIFMAVYKEFTGVEITFWDWMQLGIPAVVIFLPIVWLWLTRSIGDVKDISSPVAGPWRTEERRVLTVFAVAALAWVTRSAPFGGWSEWLGIPGAGDSTVALTAALALFLRPDGHGERLLDWKWAVKIPWGILLLVGGGIAIARAFEVSGLSQEMGQALSGLGSLPPLAMMAVICLGVTFLTEVTSNTATTALLMPVLASAGLAADIDPSRIMIPAVISASCAFMLPAATGPNAIVFSSGLVSVREMAREGLVLNLIGVVVVTGLCYFLV